MKYKSNKGKIGAIALILVLVLAIGFLGYISKGFKDWNVTDWFKTETETKANIEEGTAEINNISASALSEEPFLNAYVENDVLYFNFSSGGYEYGDGIMVSVFNKNNLTEDFLVWGSEPHVIYELTEELINFLFNVPVEYSTTLSGLSIPLADLDFNSFENLDDVIIMGGVFNFSEESFNFLLFSNFISLSDFEPVFYKVTLNANGGIFNYLEETCEILILDVQQGFDFYHVPVRAGYHFLGWYLNGELYNINQPVLSYLTLIAEWAPNTFSIAFNANGGTFKNGSELIYVDVTFGANLEYPEVFKEGYKLVGWHSGYSDWLNKDGFVIRNSTLTAEWEPIYYKVTLNANGGSFFSSDNILIIFIQHGYTIYQNNSIPISHSNGNFIGWKLNGENYNINQPVFSDLNLIAVWDLPLYYIYLDTNGGDIINTLYSVEMSGTFNPPIPVREGYTFKGWKYLDGQYFIGNPKITSDLTLVAEWSPITYTLTFKANGGVLRIKTDYNVLTLNVQYGLIIETASNSFCTLKEVILLNTGYTFKGWYLNGELYNINQPVFSDLTLIAEWDVQILTVTYDALGGVINIDGVYYEKYQIQVVYGSSLEIPINMPVREGYYCDIWWVIGDSFKTHPYNSGITVSENLTLVISWFEITYSIDVNANGGVFSINNIEYGRTAVKVRYGVIFEPPVPVRAGYTFKGWTVNGFKEVYIPVVVTEWFFLMANWEPCYYKVTLNANGGICEIEILNVISNETFNFPKCTREGYNLIGWKLNGKIYEMQPVTSDMTLIAQWEVKKFTVVFFIDSEIFKTITVDYGTTFESLKTEASKLFLNIKSTSFENASILNAKFITDNVIVVAEKQTTAQSFLTAVTQYWYFVLAGVIALAVVGVLIFGKSPRRHRRW